MELKLENRKKIKEAITSKICQVFSDDSLNVKRKQDQTLVTEIDIFVSDLVKSALHLNGRSFLSEEDQGEFVFPLFILDPIDGTKELIQGIPECCLSLAYLEEDKKTGWGWIFNPFTGFEISTDDNFTKPFCLTTQKLIGLVSSSEWMKGLFLEKNYKHVILAPKGSIAFKLGLLAAGACDFVITKKPKSIWDIAAGTILCWQRGIKFYQNGIEVKSLNKIRLENDMLWCRPGQFEIINKDLYT